MVFLVLVLKAASWTTTEKKGLWHQSHTDWRLKLSEI